MAWHNLFAHNMFIRPSSKDEAEKLKRTLQLFLRLTSKQTLKKMAQLLKLSLSFLSNTVLSLSVEQNMLEK